MFSYFRKTILLFSFSIIVLSCGDKADEPAPETVGEYLTVQNFDKLSDSGDMWAFITGPEGELLDSKLLPFGVAVALEAPLDLPGVDLTIIKRGEQPPLPVYRYLVTYTDVPKGTEFVEGFADIDLTATTSGRANFNISNLPDGWITDQFPLEFGNGLTLGNSLKQTEAGIPIPQFRCETIKENSTFLIRSIKGGDPVYAIVKDVKDKSTFSLDFNTDFKKCETIVDLGGPSHPFFATTYGHFSASKESFILSQAPDVVGPYNWRIGYPNGFDFYTTQIEKHGTDKFWSYFKVGSPMTELVAFPDYEITTDNSGIYNLAGSTTVTYNQAQALFTSGSLQWIIFGPKINNLARKSVPQEIRSKFATINFDNFKPYRLAVEIAGQSYPQYLIQHYSGVRPNQFQQQWVHKFKF